MHEKALNKIRGQVLNALRNCSVERRWPVYDTYQNNILEAATEVLKHKKDWLTVWNVFSIFMNKVSQALAEIPDQLPERPVSLQELLSEEIISSLSENIVSYIDSIPRTYLIYFPLPGLDRLGMEVVELAEGLSIRHYDVEENVPGGVIKNALYRHLKSNSLSIGISYLCVQEIGYASGYPEDSVFIQALSKLKQFIHLGFMLKIFTEKKRPPLALALLGSDQQSPTLYAIAFDQNEGDVACCSTLIPRNVAIYIDKVGYNKESQDYKQIKEQSTDRDYEFIHHKFYRPAKLITCSPDNKYSTTIKTAIEWAFDAASNENETIAFIQTCIGLEAILGDESDRESLTETLADRCAYLIGTNLEKRSKIKANFKKLYNLRSKLVHGRSVRLKYEDKDYLDWGRNILDYVISKEMINLNIDNKK